VVLVKPGAAKEFMINGSFRKVTDEHLLNEE